MIELSQGSKYKNRKMYKPPPKDDNSTNYKKLIIVIIISFVFITGEFIGGYISHSISVISDAFHLVTDLLGFVVSFVFLWFSKKKPNKKMSFGYHRMEIIGALGNLFIIWALALFFLYEATNRIINKQFVENPMVMLIVAAVGLPINIVMFFVLHGGGSHSHGLMSEPCGQQYESQGTSNNDNFCSQMICEDIECLINHQYQEHCHKKEGQNQEIHKHQVKVIVQGDKVKRKLSNDLNLNHQHKNCSHQHDHKHDHGHDHKHDHKEGQKCSHDHKNVLGQSAENIHKEPMQQKTKKKKRKSKNKKQHNHQGHNHQGHNHQGHNHQGHNHQGHNHQGHDHGHNHHQHESMSMRAAILHALSDVIQSIGLIISALIIFFAGSDMGKQVTEWNNVHYCDPITTYIFSTIVFIATIPIAKNCYHIIMQSTPGHLSSEQLTAQIQKVQGVVDVHDLHIWELRPGKTLLIAHVFSKKGQQTNVLKQLTDLSRRKRIFHSTFQVQQQDLRHDEQYILCDHDIH